MSNLTDIVEGAVQDSQLQPMPESVTVEATPVEAGSAEETNFVANEVDTSTTSPSDASTGQPLGSTDNSARPASQDAAAATPAKPADVNQPVVEVAAVKEEEDFNKRFGLPPGNANRIPQPRVKQMVQKAEKDVTAKYTKLIETDFVPKLREYETKIKTYDEQLENVARFEQVMVNDPEQFLTTISKIPSYKPFFDYVGQMSQVITAIQQEQAKLGAVNKDPMPQPITLADGTVGYDEAGIHALTDWQARQVEAKVNQRIRPIEQTYQQQQEADRRARAKIQQLEQLKPVVDKQITEARTWPSFAELEPTIVQILHDNPSINLEGAYMRAYQANVVPKMQTDREALRKSLLEEIRKAPVSSTAGPSSQVRPNAQGHSGAPKSLAEIVEESVRNARR